MERLSKQDRRGWYVHGTCGEESDGTISVVKERGRHVDRLASYEDTGLMPEEVTTIIKSQIATAKDNVQLRAERDTAREVARRVLNADVMWKIAPTMRDALRELAGEVEK